MSEKILPAKTFASTSRTYKRQKTEADIQTLNFRTVRLTCKPRYSNPTFFAVNGDQTH